ncbi:MAG: hypothetical protein AVDCRST_MAG12-418, partial [uncultured Rubrobacteraceae bacterium]
ALLERLRLRRLGLRRLPRGRQPRPDLPVPRHRDRRQRRHSAPRRELRAGPTHRGRDNSRRRLPGEEV